MRKCLLMALSSQQKAFVDHDPSRPARLLAGPGTGKSFTSVQFLEGLSRERPELRVRMLTFTRAATAEFAAKVGDAQLGGLGMAPPTTVHSFALSLLMRIEGVSLPMPLRIPDTWEAKKLVRPHLSRRLKAQGHNEATPTVVEALEREMSAGWEALDPERELYSEKNPQLGHAYVGMWQEHRWAFGYVLVGELPYQAGIILADHGTDGIELDLLLIDEYQDLNEADIKMIRLIADGGTTVLAIGDDDQSIYGFRMAAPEGIRRFLVEFAAEYDYPLTESRRCGGNILAAARALIESEPGRPRKAPLLPTAGTAPGVYAYLRFSDNHAELTGVADIIAARIAAGVKPTDIAVLIRSQMDVWADELRPLLAERAIAVASSEWVVDALAVREARRGIALGQLSLRRDDSLSWWALLGLTAGVGPSFVDYVYDHADRPKRETFGQALLRLHLDGFSDGPSGSSRARDMVRTTLEELLKLDIENAALDERNWGGWLLDHLDPEGLTEDVVRLFTMVGRAVPPTDGIKSFLAQLEPLGKDLAASSDDGVRMMTMAQSKGLTVNTAIVLGVEEGIVPMPPPKGDLNEERRLLYVAMTRATDMCLLTYAKRRTGRSARIGAAKVWQTRNRSPLLASLPGATGDPTSGTEFLGRLGS